MQAPWVNYLLFVLAYTTAFNHGVAAVNCSAITVPNLNLFYYNDLKLEVDWLRTIPNANYSIKSCCRIEPLFTFHMDDCAQCPRYDAVPGCKDDLDKSSRHCEYYYAQQQVTFYFTLTVNVPGCESKSEKSTIFIHPSIYRTRPVKDLNFEVKPDGLLATWDHESEGYLLQLCYFYNGAAISENGERQEILKNMIKTTSVTVPLPGTNHAYKMFEVCVKSKICQIKDDAPFSKEKCIRKRTPPTAPSKPLEMLCGTKPGYNDCRTVSDRNERNVTLVWKLPDNSTWNGLPTVIKIIAVNGNQTDRRNISSAKTSYTLRKLKKNVMYEVQLQFCSNGGCGPRAEPIGLHPIKEVKPVAPPNDEEVNPQVLIIIVVSSVVLMVAVILILTYLVISSKRKRDMATLPGLQPPDQEPVQSGTDPTLRTNPGDYDFLLCTSEEPQIQLNLPDHLSLNERNSCDDSNSTHSTNDSASCPLVTQTPDTSPDEGNVDVTYYPERSGNGSGALTSSGDRTI